MIPRFLNTDVEKMGVTSSEMVKFGVVSGLEEKYIIVHLDLMSSW